MAVVGGARLTPAELKRLLKSDSRLYYVTPHLNDKLYLHYKGYLKLESLEEFTGLRVLYAEANGEHMNSMDCDVVQHTIRFLQENCITRIENLNTLTQLYTLNLSNNFIEKIENLESNIMLNTLQLQNNQIGANGLDDVKNLVQLHSLSILDLSDNSIDDPAILQDVLLHMSNLRVLYLKGNPLCKKIENYRKTIISTLKNLTYLDDRPVFKDEKRCAEAFVRGGIEEERTVRKQIQEEQTLQRERNNQAFIRMIKETREEHRARTNNNNHQHESGGGTEVNRHRNHHDANLQQRYENQSPSSHQSGEHESIRGNDQLSLRSSQSTEFSDFAEDFHSDSVDNSETTNAFNSTPMSTQMLFASTPEHARSEQDSHEHSASNTENAIHSQNDQDIIPPIHEDTFHDLLLPAPPPSTPPSRNITADEMNENNTTPMTATCDRYRRDNEKSEDVYASCRPYSSNFTFLPHQIEEESAESSVHSSTLLPFSSVSIRTTVNQRDDTAGEANPSSSSSSSTSMSPSSQTAGISHTDIDAKGVVLLSTHEDTTAETGTLNTVYRVDLSTEHTKPPKLDSSRVPICSVQLNDLD